MGRNQDRPAIEHVVKQQKFGIRSSLIGREEIKKRPPQANLGHIVGGCCEEGKGYALRQEALSRIAVCASRHI